MQLHKWTFISSFIILILFAIFPEWDLAISSYFYVPGEGFIYAHATWADSMFHLIPMMTTCLVIFLCIGLSIKFFYSQNRREFLKSPMIFLALALLLGPALSVNFLLKENFGRARPHQIVQFGGTKEFTRVGHYTDQCESNCSFSSGHASMGFYVTSFSHILPQPEQSASFIMGLVFGLAAGFSRIVAGAHFFSDVISSLFVVMLMNEISFRIWKKLCNKPS